MAELEAGDLGRRKVAVVLLGRPGGDGSSYVSSDLSQGLEVVRPQAQPPRPVRGSEVCHKQWGADYGRRHESQVVFGRLALATRARRVFLGSVGSINSC